MATPFEYCLSATRKMVDTNTPRDHLSSRLTPHASRLLRLPSATLRAGRAVQVPPNLR